DAADLALSALEAVHYGGHVVWVESHHPHIIYLGGYAGCIMVRRRAATAHAFDERVNSVDVHRPAQRNHRGIRHDPCHRDSLTRGPQLPGSRRPDGRRD